MTYLSQQSVPAHFLEQCKARLKNLMNGLSREFVGSLHWFSAIYTCPSFEYTKVWYKCNGLAGAGQLSLHFKASKVFSDLSVVVEQWVRWKAGWDIHKSEPFLESVTDQSRAVLSMAAATSSADQALSKLSAAACTKSLFTKIMK